MHPDLVIGIDTGGTTTRAAIAERSGRVLATGTAGPGNLRDGGMAVLTSRVDEAVRAAFNAAGLARRPVRSGFLGIAGCGTKADRSAAQTGVQPLGLAPAESLTIDHDLRIAHAGVHLDSPGLVLIAGTGACCYGRTGTGIGHRAGGWGSRLDDGGSATWLGLRALAAWCRAVDGRGPASELCGAIAEHLGISTPRGALVMLEAPDCRTQIAALAPLVTRAAVEGDAVAVRIVHQGATELTEMIAAVAKTMARHEPGRRYPMGLVGGVFSGGPIVRDALDRELDTRVLPIEVVDPLLPPVRGAVFLALQSLGPVSLAQREALAEAKPI